MVIVSNVELPDSWTLYALKPSDQSPMEGHKFGEIAADIEHGALYIHEVVLRQHGTEAIQKNCNEFIQSRNRRA